jgi:hypothetical protein
VRVFFIGGSLLRVVVTTVLPDGRRSRRSFFSPSVQQASGHSRARHAWILKGFASAGIRR